MGIEIPKEIGDYYKDQFLNSLKSTVFRPDEKWDKLIDIIIENKDKINWDKLYKELPFDK